MEFISTIGQFYTFIDLDYILKFGLGFGTGILLLKLKDFYFKPDTELLDNEPTEISGITKTKDIQFNGNVQNTLAFFDNYMKIKFEFYLLNDLMANIITGRELNPSLINETKQKFFMDVSTSLNEEFFDILGILYTKPGLQLYVHQTFLSLLNKSQLAFKETDSKKFDKRTIDAIMGS